MAKTISRRLTISKTHEATRDNQRLGVGGQRRAGSARAQAKTGSEYRRMGVNSNSGKRR